ncbi:MAG: DNA damage-inducible protein D [Muribaculaceae bacterium]|nr:DNA damage-inducible protein D [Muribaculaceae bacterium]
MSNKLTKKTKETFESIKKTDENGVEYWTARDLSKVLGYSEYRFFLPAARKAWNACRESGQNPNDHFEVFHDMIMIGKGAERQIDNIKITRYGCYMTVQNADSSKPIVAQAQTYFAVQTRRAEILLDGAQLTEEDQRRLLLRGEMKKHNVQLAGTAKNAGVETSKDYAIFQNAGYEGLYAGLNKQDIHERKGLSKSQDILDHMGSTELAANLFRATQTEEKLKKDNIQGKEKANQVHRQIGAKVRKAIKDIGGTMPEDLPVAESIKKLERKEKKLKQLKGNNEEEGE